mgnify:FL=1
MTIHTAYPVIKVINGNQEGIRLGPNDPSPNNHENKSEGYRSHNRKYIWEEFRLGKFSDIADFSGMP